MQSHRGQQGAFLPSVVCKILFLVLSTFLCTRVFQHKRIDPLAFVLEFDSKSSQHARKSSGAVRKCLNKPPIVTLHFDRHAQGHSAKTPLYLDLRPHVKIKRSSTPRVEYVLQ